MTSPYSYKPGMNVIRTEMDAGPARTRRRFRSVPTDLNVCWIFTLAQLQVFERFYNKDIFDGESYFNLKVVNGMGETTVEARFKEPYDAEAMDKFRLFKISAKLEVRSMPIAP